MDKSQNMIRAGVHIAAMAVLDKTESQQRKATFGRVSDGKKPSWCLSSSEQVVTIHTEMDLVFEYLLVVFSCLASEHIHVLRHDAGVSWRDP